MENEENAHRNINGQLEHIALQLESIFVPKADRDFVCQ